MVKLAIEKEQIEEYVICIGTARIQTRVAEILIMFGLICAIAALSMNLGALVEIQEMQTASLLSKSGLLDTATGEYYACEAQLIRGTPRLNCSGSSIPFIKKDYTEFNNYAR